MAESLMAALAAAGKPAVALDGADGCRIVVSPHGGRVLGLFAPAGGANFLWTNPVLWDAGSARAFFESGAWCNLGGDRTWLAPEADFFLPKFPDASVYFQPRQLDPGRYRCSREGGGFRLETDLRLHSYRTGEDLSLRIVKRVEPAANPLRGGAGFGPAEGLAFAGYTLRGALEFIGPPARTAVGLWHLLQLPHGGEVRIPTRARCEPKVYFGAIPPRDLAVDDRSIRYAMRIPGEHKIGVRAAAATGRVGYVCPSGRDWALVVRDFRSDPAGLYADFPWDDPRDTGYAVQACNVSNETLGHFSELEYHVPAIGGDAGAARCEDVSRVWAFRGARAAVEALADAMLTAERVADSGAVPDMPRGGASGSDRGPESLR
jgi:hypothetical protein